MKWLLRCFQAALALFALGVLFSLPDLVQACNEANKLDGRSLGADGFLVSDDPVPIDCLTAEEAAAAGCPVPPCINTVCSTVNPSTPFKRLVGHEALPVSRHAGCFGIAKRDASFYIQLSLDGPGNGIHRHVSTDGGFTWTTGSVVIAPNTGWWGGIKCPDLEYLPTGELLLYFRGAGTGGNPAGIARAISTDDGFTWTADPGPVLTSPVTGYFVDNPSVLRRSATSWVMAYTLGCAGPGVTGPFQMAETHLAYSNDGINWTHSVANPALVPGSCGAWDQGAIANPVLVADPVAPFTIHLFYTGADWNGQTTRGCAKIGHAISTNNGRTWCKTKVVLDHPAAGSPAWDDIQYMVSDYTIEPNNKIRMYYWAQGTTLGSGLGVAEANWPLAGCGPASGDDHWNANSAPLPGTSPGVETATSLYLRSQPNPTSGGVVIQHNLSRGDAEGSGSVSIVDIQGRQIARVWRGQLNQAPAQFEWDGLSQDGSKVAAGRYLIRLEGLGEVLATGWVTVMP